MTPMKRSLSSPVRINPSSESVLHTHEHSNTRAQSPTPASSHSPTGPRRARSGTLTPPEDPAQALPLRTRQEGARHSRQSSTISTSGKPIVAQVAPPKPEHVRRNSNDRSGHPVTPTQSSHEKKTSTYYAKSLLQDLSQYTNPHLTRDTENTTLEELAHIVRLSKYQERKRANTRTRLQRSLISTALSARLTRCGDVAHRNLFDTFRKDEKDSFTTLYNAIHDVRRSCDELRRYALVEPDLESLSSAALGSSENLDKPANSASGTGGLSRSAAPFLQEISVDARNMFLDFLNNIRTNPEYLATRLTALTSSELQSLLSYHKGLEPVESVLPYHGRSGGRSHASTTARPSGNADVERLLAFQRHDPLSILIHTCFANSAGPDSLEDQRRTDIWATALARLISEPKSTGEQFLVSVLNIWTTMRDWSGKSNMEFYLMKILKDGAFLLERAEDQHGTRFNLADWDHSDQAAANEFYDTAVHELFELVDDEDATGIPEGLLELGNAILSKLENKYVENSSRWLVWRCLFFVFLLGVISYPEAYGMLSEHHITPYAREKILKKVAMKAHEYVSILWTGKPSATCAPVDIPVRIKAHVDSIMSRFRGARSKTPTTKLLPARSITSLRETAEVHPYLIVSPADMDTLVNALFPERKPMSGSSSFRSGPASVSGMSAVSQPISMAHSRTNTETASIISTSAGSDVTASGDGFFADPTVTMTAQQRYSPPVMDTEALRRQGKYEEDGYRLRLALHELKTALGAEATRGTCHPCAERWMVLFISPDGKSLSTHMTYDPDDEHEEDEASSTTDTDEDDTANGPHMDKDYHQLRDSILRLVQDYEIPRNLESETGPLSNRASGLKKYKSRSRIITPETTMASRNPYRNQVNTDVESSPEAVSTNPARGTPKHEPSEAVLITMLKSASAQSKSQADFVASHMYWKTLKQLERLDSSSSLRQNGFAALINIFSRGPRDSIRRSAAAIEEYDAWLIWLKQSQERHEGHIDRMMRRVRAIRDKMWFVADVRNSREYTHSRDICQALRTMAQPRRWSSIQRTKTNAPRGTANSYLIQTESQIMDLLAASDDQGGPNKLSDDQSDLVLKWLRQYGIENFCRGEERIHRFCCEVDKCVKKLVGETLRDAPVLWSSELYRRDKAAFERMKARERDQHTWTGDESSSIMSDGAPRFASSSRPGSLHRDPRAQSSHSGSQHSLDARFGIPRSSAPLSEILDGHDYFDKHSPQNTIDTASTFWTPFQPAMSPGSGNSRAYSPTTSLTNLSTTFSGSNPYANGPSSSSMSMGRPGTSASSNETLHQQRNDDEKTRFLTELRQTLTSLLLSDLGSLVISRGSETDAWFAKFGQSCLDRKEALDRRARQKLDREKEKEKDKEKERERETEASQSRFATRPRVLEKKRSFGNLRGLGDQISERGSDITEVAVPPATHPKENARVNDKMDWDSHNFPFKKAYQRLLNTFCVHPNPYAKLNALNELENLISASLSAKKSKRSRWNRSDAGSSATDEFGVRSQGSQASMAPTGREGAPPGPGVSDIIVNELLALFRDASIRPASLFRDLQLIAAFVPPSIIDQPEKGTAFWNTGMAALKLKGEVCRTMMSMADEIVAAHAVARKAFEASSDEPHSATSTPPPPSTSYSLEDAGKMWAITAKEGYSTAQRELALFYLANPEAVERTTQPLSKPREVFKPVVMEKYGRNEKGRPMAGAPGAGIAGPQGSASRLGGSMGSAFEKYGTEEADPRNDPGLMCVAVHWMEAAEQGGDELAKNFLRENEFVGFK